MELCILRSHNLLRFATISDAYGHSGEEAAASDELYNSGD